MGPRLSSKILRKMLKVSLYTSLNGGNPASDARLCDSFELNAETIFKACGEDIEFLKGTPEFKIMKEVLAEFPLGKALKKLNNKCVIPSNPYFPISQTNPGMVYAIDKATPYSVKSAHMGILRVLQGFELIMLCNMTHQCVKLGGLPVSLDHDGLYVCLPATRDARQFTKGMDEACEEWGRYLLQMKVPIVGKRITLQGRIENI